MAIGAARRKKTADRRSHLKTVTPSMPPPPSFSSSRFFRYFRKRMSLFISLFFLILAAVFLLSISSNAFRTQRSVTSFSPIYTIEVVNEFPHDPNAFTQGLLYGGDDTLFESTGLYEHSSVRKVSLQSGEILAIHNMERSSFGEGLTLLNDRLYQVTWLQNTGFIYDRKNLSKFEKFTHQMQDGWGLATDGQILFGTDGSSTLYLIDPRSLKVLTKHIVKYNGLEIHNLNELEYVNDEVWANVWQTDCIARISPKDGVVREWILLHSLREGLVAAGIKNFDVLNGIAWDKEKERIFVTGKLWPKIYEIKLHPMKKQLHETIEDICMTQRFHFGRS